MRKKPFCVLEKPSGVCWGRGSVGVPLSTQEGREQPLPSVLTASPGAPRVGEVSCFHLPPHHRSTGFQVHDTLISFIWLLGTEIQVLKVYGTGFTEASSQPCEVLINLSDSSHGCNIETPFLWRTFRWTRKRKIYFIKRETSETDLWKLKARRT